MPGLPRSCVIVPTKLAALAAGVPEATIRKWASRGRLTRYGRPGRAEYDLDELYELVKQRSLPDTRKNDRLRRRQWQPRKARKQRLCRFLYKWFFEESADHLLQFIELRRVKSRHTIESQRFLMKGLA
jgi:hypothetical protein